MRRRVLGPKDPAVANSLVSLADVYKNMAEYSKALSLLDEALKLRKKILPADHPDIPATLASLASVYELMGQPSKCQPLREVRLVVVDSIGRLHPSSAPCV